MGRIPLTSMDKIMREVGAERVSEEAKIALRDILEEEAKGIIKKSVQLARHTSRTTLLKEDIMLGKQK